MALPRVIKQESVTLAQGAPGVTVSRIVTEETGATQISSGITTFGPGSSNTTHFHNAEESVIVIEGEGTLVLQGKSTALGLTTRLLSPRAPTTVSSIRATSPSGSPGPMPRFTSRAPLLKRGISPGEEGSS